MTDPSKFTSLFVKYERRLYSIIASMLGHPAEAEDLLQETAKVLWKKSATSWAEMNIFLIQKR